MKVLQAIVTSSVETLDNRQGLGLVLCSKALPEDIRKQARDWGYSQDAKGLPIFSLRRTDVSGTDWIVMNRTVPATDFTGRTSHVSHTIAIRLSDLNQWLGRQSGRIESPFEFMLRYPWADTWAESPHLIEEADDSLIQAASIKRDERHPREYLPSAPLLAFECPDKRRLVPKSLIWKIDGTKPDELLRLFHEAWVTADPWRVEKNYDDPLEGPNISLAEAWECTFTTNLRNERPDPYKWIMLTSESRGPGNREIMDTAEWSNLGDDEIAQKIGEPFGALLVARSSDPEAWARTETQRRISETISNFERRKEREAGSEQSALIRCIDEMKLEIGKLEVKIIDHQKANDGTDISEDITKTLASKESEIIGLIQGAEKSHQSMVAEFQSQISPLHNLLKTAHDSIQKGQTGPSVSLGLFDSSRSEFMGLSDKYREASWHVAALELAKKLHDEEIEHSRRLNQLESQIASNTTIIAKLENIRSAIFV